MGVQRVGGSDASRRRRPHQVRVRELVVRLRVVRGDASEDEDGGGDDGVDPAARHVARLSRAVAVDAVGEIRGGGAVVVGGAVVADELLVHARVASHGRDVRVSDGRPGRAGFVWRRRGVCELKRKDAVPRRMSTLFQTSVGRGALGRARGVPAIGGRT